MKPNVTTEDTAESEMPLGVGDSHSLDIPSGEVMRRVFGVGTTNSK